MVRTGRSIGLFVLAMAVGLARPAAAQVSLTALDSAVSQNFNTLASTGTSSSVPAGWAFSESDTNADTTYTAGNGSGTAGDTYSFGATGSSDRAFGGVLSGSLVPTIGGAFTNNTGSTITSLDVAYTGEQWRLGTSGRGADRLDFQYSTNATSLTNGTWTDVDALDFSSPVITGTVGALDGNAAANRTAKSFTVTGLSIANGATFRIRWNDFNVTNADDGLAVDDFSLTPHGGGGGGETFTHIHTLQGSGTTSPLTGSSVTTRGVVTGVKSNGFFIQEPDATVDADPATSEGVFVFTSSAPPAAASAGNLVEVTGTVSEFVPGADPFSPPVTEITGPSVSLISSGNPLPTAVALTATFPDPAGGISQLERIEGMRASVASLTVVAPTGGTVDEPAATSTTNGVFYGVVTGVARPFREPGIEEPDPAPSGSIPPIPRFDANPERIRVDSDGLTGASPLDVGAGAVITGLAGPLDYSFRTYSILPDPGAALGVTGGPTATPVAQAGGNEVTVASFNMERFFDTVDDAGTSDVALTSGAFNQRLAKASLAVRNYLKTPDIVGIEEMEHLSTLQAVAAKISADAVAAGQPDPQYAAYLQEGNDIGGIDVGFLVKTAPVAGSTPRVSVDAVVQENAGSLFVNPDNSTELLNDRPPLRLMAVVHHANGASYPVTVIVNHLRSLGSVDSTAAGSNGWATAGERVRAKRQQQAEELADLVQARQTADPNEHIVLVGDFNAFEVNDGYGDSMDVIQGTPVPDDQTAVPGDGVDLVNPDLVNLVSTPPAAERYSYTFDGNAQNLDHILVGAAVVASTQARRIEHARIDADFPETARNNGASPTRLSDHDPMVAYLSVPAFSNGDLYTLTPCRLLDTRNLVGGPLASGVAATAAAQGSCGIPATARAIVLNVVVVNPSGGGFLTLYPSDQAQPLASTVNFATGQVLGNNAVVRLGADGKLKLFPSVGGGGTVHVVIDVAGYFD